MGSLAERASNSIARYKQWLTPFNYEETRRPNPVHDEYQLLPVPEEPSSDSEVKDENGLVDDESSSSVDRTCAPAKKIRPPINFDSPKAFVQSLYARFLSLWTPSFLYALLGGQLISLCLTCSSVTTTELVNRNWVLPSTQTFFTYLSLFAVYTPYTIYRYGLSGWRKVITHDGWKYFLLAVFDVEGNFLAVKAYDYTDLLSCMLLDAWAIPVCLFVSWIYMRTKYHWTQILGVFVSIGGLGLLLISDLANEGHAESRALGDAFMLTAATIFGIVNATEEFFVRHSPLYEVVGQLGMWGMLVNGIQAVTLERGSVSVAPWDRGTIGLLLIYTMSLFLFYSLAPVLYRTASSSYLNMSLLTSDFYGLFFGLFLFHYTPYWLYFPAFVIVILGLVIYFWQATPEEQGESDVRIPSYITRERDIES